MIAYSKTPTSLVVVLGFVPRTVPKSHPNFDKLVELVSDPATTEQQLLPLIELPKPSNQFSSAGNVVIRDGQLFYKGFAVKNSLSKTILDLVAEGRVEAAKPFELFLENAFQNPDRRAVDDLFDWVVHTGLPITPDGHILAWKAVREDYYSIHGYNARNPQFFHGIGSVVEQDRSLCDANPNVTCSSGLHFAAASYLPHYASGGSRIVALKINPADVVAFPKDYGWAKGRASRYTVVGEVPLDKVPEFYPQGKRIYGGWGSTTANLVAKSTPRTANGFAVGQVWRDGVGREHTIIDTNSSAQGYPLQTDFGRFTAAGRYVSDSETNTRDLKTLVRDVA